MYNCARSSGKRHGKGRFGYHRTSLVGMSPRGGSPDPAAADVGVANVDVGVHDDDDDDVLADSPPPSPLGGVRGRGQSAQPPGRVPGQGAAVWAVDDQLQQELTRKEARLH